MITEIVTWTMPPGITQEEATLKYRLSVPTWQANPNLFHKAFLFDAATRRGGGVYLWNSIEAAKEAHGAAFRERIRSLFGAEPEFQYFDTPIVIDNVAKQVTDEAA
jgi:hypothetical protein